MIRAYPKHPSIFQGENLVLHVSSTCPLFKIEIYRQGNTLDLIHSTSWMTGYNFPEGEADQEWGWLGYNIPTVSTWQTGVYIAIFIEGDKNGNEINRPNTTTADGRTNKAYH